MLKRLPKGRPYDPNIKPQFTISRLDWERLTPEHRRRLLELHRVRMI